MKRQEHTAARLARAAAASPWPGLHGQVAAAIAELVHGRVHRLGDTFRFTFAPGVSEHDARCLWSVAHEIASRGGGRMRSASWSDDGRPQHLVVAIPADPPAIRRRQHTYDPRRRP